MEKAKVNINLTMGEYEKIVNAINNIYNQSNTVTFNKEELINQKESCRVNARIIIDILQI